MERSIPNNLGLGIIFLYAVMPFFGFFSLKFLGRSPNQLILLLSLLSVILFLFERGKIEIPTYILVFSIFTLYTILSDIFLADKSLGFGYIRRNSFLGSLLMLFVISSVHTNNWHHQIIDKISYYTIYIAFLVILVQGFVSSTFFTPPEHQAALQNTLEMEGRLPSIYGWLGSLYEIGICFFPVLGLFIEKEIKANNGRNYLILFLIGAIVALLNKSRFLLLNYALLFFLIPIHKGWKLIPIIRYIIITLGLFLLLYFGSRLTPFDFDKYINERLLEKQYGGISQGAASSRVIAFEVFAKLFPDNPVWGKGKLHQFGEGTHASRDIALVRTLHRRSSQIHVGYLSLFYYYGIIGGGIYVLFLILLTRKLNRDAKKTGHYAILIGWIMFIITNLTLVSIDIFHMGIAIILYFNQYNLKKSAEII